MTATISEIARLAEVSEQTVARVVAHSPLVSDDIHARVRHAMAETGFAPQRLPRAATTRRNPLVALVYSGDVTPLVREAEAGAGDALKATAHSLCLRPLDDNPRTLLKSFGEFLETLRPAAVILTPPLSADDRLAGLAWEHGCACLRLGTNALPADDPDWLALPEREAARDAVRWLAERGHRRIGLIPGYDPCGEREAGYEAALAELGLDVGVSLIADCEESFASALDAALLLLEISPPPTAVIAGSGTIAAAVLRAASIHKIAVPLQLTILSLDDEAISRSLTPPIARMRRPCREAVREAVSRAIRAGCAVHTEMQSAVIIEPEE
ncbi:MAG: LacI family DNA-binding transcriptional regulator [Sphingomonadaceae bacterium]